MTQLATPVGQQQELRLLVTSGRPMRGAHSYATRETTVHKNAVHSLTHPKEIDPSLLKRLCTDDADAYSTDSRTTT